MTRLTSEQVLEDNNSQDPLAIATLKLNHKALSDINCLAVFKNLEKLDLTFNNLTSLEGLKSCTNLKWLSVVQNKLESLKGIEGLSKLTVLNAGKNKLQSMDDIRSLVGLCALILNDNEIVSICKLDQLKNLNTLVLSRNPIHRIGDSLFKVKSMKKLSFSNCKLQSIDSSLKSCIELKELRLAHNDIKTLPADLVHNKKLLNLDLGYNIIMRWSDLKVLKSLSNLRNLNLQGNPIAENAKLANKIHKVLPGLHILNAKPIEKHIQNEKDNSIDEEDDTSNQKLENRREKRDGKLKLEHQKHLSSQGSDDEIDHANGNDAEAKSNRKRHKMEKIILEEKKVPSPDNDGDHGTKKNPKTDNANAITKENSSKAKRPKNEKLSLKDDPGLKETDTQVDNKQKKKANKVRERQVDVVDDTEASFAELFAGDGVGGLDSGHGELEEMTIKDMNLDSNLVSFEVNRKASKNHGKVARLQLAPEVEIGMGGPSTWGDE